MSRLIRVLSLQGSYLCGACAPSYFLAGDGTCAACPVNISTWDRYGTLVLLIACVVGFALLLSAVLACVAVAAGFDIKGIRAVSRYLSLCAGDYLSRRHSVACVPAP